MNINIHIHDYSTYNTHTQSCFQVVFNVILDCLSRFTWCLDCLKQSPTIPNLLFVPIPWSWKIPRLRLELVCACLLNMLWKIFINWGREEDLATTSIKEVKTEDAMAGVMRCQVDWKKPCSSTTWKSKSAMISKCDSKLPELPTCKGDSISSNTRWRVLRRGVRSWSCWRCFFAESAIPQREQQGWKHYSNNQNRRVVENDSNNSNKQCPKNFHLPSGASWSFNLKHGNNGSNQWCNFCPRLHSRMLFVGLSGPPTHHKRPDTSTYPRDQDRLPSRMG